MFNESNPAINTASNLTPATQAANTATVGHASSTQMTHPVIPAQTADIGEDLDNMPIGEMTDEQVVNHMKNRRHKERARLLDAIIQHKAAVLKEIAALEKLDESGNFNKGTTQDGLTQLEAELVGILKIRGPVALTLIQQVFDDQELKKARHGLKAKGLLEETAERNTKVLSLPESGRAAA